MRICPIFLERYDTALLQKILDHISEYYRSIYTGTTLFKKAMALGSGIEWTDATWNPSTGCTKVSPGCANCYAEALSHRLRAMGQTKYRNGFAYTEHAETVDIPLRWKKPRRIFVNSMSDLFHQEATLRFVVKCFDVMLRASWHTYQILTKRPHAMAKFSRLFRDNTGRDIPGHIWMGTSVESGKYLYRIDELRGVACRTRFISFEPLLGPVGLVNLDRIDWAIIGGEAGRGFRKMKKEWVADLIDRCKAQGVPIFFKQWGGPRPKSGGCLVDGVEYRQYPPARKDAAGPLNIDCLRFAKSVGT